MNSMIFNWSRARALATASAVAYRCATVSDAGSDAQANVTLSDDGQVIVAFRGSSSPRDFLADGEAWMSDLVWLANNDPCRVHTGFLKDFEAINVEVVRQVKALLTVNYGSHVYLTGHSLGGALAILCALEFQRQGIPIAGVYTFGQPRVGNAAFRDIYDRALYDFTFRVVNQNDIVPRTPGLLMKYRHCGQEVFMEPGIGWGINPPLAYKMLCDALGLYGAYRKREDVLIREHFITAYLERMSTIS